MNQIERAKLQAVHDMLIETGGDRTKAADRLGITTRSIRNYLKKIREHFDKYHPYCDVKRGNEDMSRRLQ